jgi:hypothetical protein
MVDDDADVARKFFCWRLVGVGVGLGRTLALRQSCCAFAVVRLVSIHFCLRHGFENGVWGGDTVARAVLESRADGGGGGEAVVVCTEEMGDGGARRVCIEEGGEVCGTTRRSGEGTRRCLGCRWMGRGQ